MKHASLFSGIGGPEVAAALLGWENVFHCEINPFGRKVLDYWFPNSISYEDITKTSFKEWRGKIDILTGGFPCQPFSYAGKRGGREDERYLWPEMLRAIDEIRPTWVVGENVAGIATMVEGGVLADVGCYATLFQEGDELHGYELEQSFTIERICGDLERLGYSVQPVLIPAAAVGAPHRRDRIFILAFNADADRRDDVRGSGEDEGKGREERLQERHEIREPGVSNQLRPSVQGTFEDPERDGCGFRTDDIEGRERIVRNAGAGDFERICREAWTDSSDASSKSEKRPSNRQPESYPRPTPGAELGRGNSEGNTSDSDSRRLERTEEGRREGAGDDALRRGRDGCEVGPVANTEDAWNPYGSWNVLQAEREVSAQCDAEPRRVCRRFCQSLLPENRWSEFPTVSPVHRGNDGLPFNVDDLAIPFSRWRTESLKAYGNAIVPQVMYRIFEAIQTCEA